MSQFTTKRARYKKWHFVTGTWSSAVALQYHSHAIEKIMYIYSTLAIQLPTECFVLGPFRCVCGAQLVVIWSYF